MTPEEYAYLEQTLTGRKGRDKEFESKMTVKAEGKFARQAEERRQVLEAKTPEMRELEQRAFSLKTYGRSHMERYARPITPGPYGELSVPCDAPAVRVLQEHSAGQRPVPPKGLKLKFHSAEPGCVMWKA